MSSGDASFMADRVGPVLEVGEIAQAVVAAIRAHHPDAETIDRGSYLRVLVPGRCVVTRLAIEERLGRPFVLPGDLERIMPSFKGRLHISDDQVTWTSAAPGPR
jgi:hypothetical protein